MTDTKRNKLRDIAAIASLLGGVGACLYFVTSDRSPTCVRIPSDKFNSSLYQLELEDLLGGDNDVTPTDFSDSYDADEAETDASHDELRSEQHERFSKGEPAELYGPSATFAVPVVVDSQSRRDDDSVTYSVIDKYSGETQYGVDETFVHKYERYQDGTKAMCVEQYKVRRSNPSIVPCLVKSSNIKTSNGVDYPVYHVVRVDADTSEMVFEYLPFQNVQRLIDEHALDGSHVLELLEDAMMTLDLVTR